MALIDGDRFEGRFRDGVHAADVSDLMRRMVKENLLKFDGTPLFPGAHCSHGALHPLRGGSPPLQGCHRLAAWQNADPPKGPGAPKVYSDTAIQCALILKSVFQLSLRSTQGFVSSLLELLRLDLPVPDYSTLSRRQSSLATFLTVSPSSRPRHVVVDATGLRVYGSGEWHVRKHRQGRGQSLA